ncbi:MAG: EF-hand domain-containing protein [Novosphingobium sp.]
MASKPDSAKAGDRSKQAVIAAADRDFQAMDGNRDGVVTRAEVGDYVVRQNPGIQPDNREKLVDLVLSRFDLDRSGTISRAEVIRVSLAHGGSR